MLRYLCGVRALLFSTLLLASAALAAPALAAPQYDLRPLAEVAPEFAPLQAALSAKNPRKASKLAVALANATTLTDVKQAAWYVLHRGCFASGAARCSGQAHVPGAADAADAPFVQLQLLSRARSSIRAGNFAAAWARLNAADDAIRETNRLLLTLAERSLQQPWSDAFSQRLEALNSALSRHDRCRLLLILGDKSDDSAGKWSAYRQVWHGKCGDLRRSALERLMAIGMTPSPLERIDWLASRSLPLKRRSRRKAERLVLREIEQVAAGISGLATYGRAVLYSRSRKRRETALGLFGEAIRLAQDADVIAAAQYRQGDLLGKLNRDAEAIKTLLPLLEMQTDPSFAADVRWRLFRLFRAQNQWLDAEAVLNDLVNSTSRWRRRALWQLAWRRFRLHDVEEALRLMTTLRGAVGADEDDGKQPWHARIDYWRARCLAQMDRKDEAKALYIAVADRHPHTYYGLIAVDRLSGLDPVATAARAPLSLADEAVPLSLSGLKVDRHPLLDAPVLLLRMGLLQAARDALHNIVPSRLPRDGVHLLAALYHLTGRPRAAYALLRRHARRAARPDDSTAGVWRVAYATPWREEFTTAATQAGIPLSLLYAVARHESHFVANARSSAGAVGVVQLLPTVAARIAGLYGLKKRSSRALLKPAYNAAIGARYLAQISSFLRGNLALVLGAYNAGPYAIRRWLKRSGPVPTDVFVESIPYGQARNYARGVLATAHAYAVLNPSWGEVGTIAAGRPKMAPVDLGPFMVPPVQGEARLVTPRGLTAPLDGGES